MSINRDAAVQDTILTMATVKQERGQERQGQAPSKRSTTKPIWNTKDLGKRLGVDVASAATAGVLTCPLITIIDR
jgi:hypothetical protein